MNIVVASTNPVKISATRHAFQKMFPGESFAIQGVTAASGVADQPQGDAETFQGACNRIKAVAQNATADFYVGIEGGIEERSDQVGAFAWVVVKSKDGLLGKGRAGTFFLPLQIAELLKQGKELGEANDIVFRRTNSKQENGAVGILTGDAVDRTKYYTDAVIFALIPFKNPSLYKTS